jgi:hypothetical protein
MIVVGGYTNPSPDPWSQGLGVFDLSSMSPRTSYDPKAGPYDPRGLSRTGTVIGMASIISRQPMLTMPLAV